MTLDIRLPMGYLFMLLGAVLLVYGLLTGAPTQGAVVGVNINAWWGVILLLFGLAMWLLARRAARHERLQ